MSNHDFTNYFDTTRFTYDEFKCQCNHCESERALTRDKGEWFRAPEFRAFMIRLIDLRHHLGFPMTVTSGYRCPDHNNAISSTGLDGPHTKGAADIAIIFERMYLLVDEATSRKMGVGIKQHGPFAKRIIHLDNDGPRLWTYD